MQKTVKCRHRTRIETCARGCKRAVELREACERLASELRGSPERVWSDHIEKFARELERRVLRDVVLSASVPSPF